MIKIVARKEDDGSIYIDKNFFERFTEMDLATYGYTKVEAPEDCRVSDFNEDLSFNFERYDSRKERERLIEYENYIVNNIRAKYTLDQELAILRQRDTKPNEFYEYDTYVEKCKAEAKSKFNI